MLQTTSAVAPLDPFNAWNTFLLAMIALSVATERVTEMLKQWLGPTLNHFLRPQRYNATVQLIAILSGIFVTALSGQNPINVPNFQPFAWGNTSNWLAWIVTGILVSGGSAFWNHLLDILQATKVAKEQAVACPCPPPPPPPPPAAAGDGN